mmetsp:Transcript_1952/g.5388  ORF Transcript_1952/g.5388 Transcript_1952/m.5388 type:complete len:215 (+) Transcript_1952:211-855(+)
MLLASPGLFFLRHLWQVQILSHLLRIHGLKDECDLANHQAKELLNPKEVRVRDELEEHLIAQVFLVYKIAVLFLRHDILESLSGKWRFDLRHRCLVVHLQKGDVVLETSRGDAWDIDAIDRIVATLHRIAQDSGELGSVRVNLEDLAVLGPELEHGRLLDVVVVVGIGVCACCRCCCVLHRSCVCVCVCVCSCFRSVQTVSVRLRFGVFESCER